MITKNLIRFTTWMIYIMFVITFKLSIIIIINMFQFFIGFIGGLYIAYREKQNEKEIAQLETEINQLKEYQREKQKNINKLDNKLKRLEKEV